MKELGVVSWKLPQREMSCQNFCKKISPPTPRAKINKFYSIWKYMYRFLNRICKLISMWYPPDDAGEILSLPCFSSSSWLSANASVDWRILGYVTWYPSGKSHTPKQRSIMALSSDSLLNGQLQKENFLLIPYLKIYVFEQSNQRESYSVSVHSWAAVITT